MLVVPPSLKLIAWIKRISSDYFDKIRQFLAGIEVYPFAGRVQISQTPVFLALNPYQFHRSLNLPADLAVFRE
jgi:hypothetical protein